MSSFPQPRCRSLEVLRVVSQAKREKAARRLALTVTGVLLLIVAAGYVAAISRTTPVETVSRVETTGNHVSSSVTPIVTEEQAASSNATLATPLVKPVAYPPVAAAPSTTTPTPEKYGMFDWGKNKETNKEVVRWYLRNNPAVATCSQYNVLTQDLVDHEWGFDWVFSETEKVDLGIAQGERLLRVTYRFTVHYQEGPDTPRHLRAMRGPLKEQDEKKGYFYIRGGEVVDMEMLLH